MVMTQRTVCLSSQKRRKNNNFSIVFGTKLQKKQLPLTMNGSCCLFERIGCYLPDEPLLEDERLLSPLLDEELSTREELPEPTELLLELELLE